MNDRSPEPPADPDIRVRRIYEPPRPTDGHRVLVDRLWPRGVSKERAAIDTWMREIAPSTDLRRWFAHDPARWPEFKRRYFAELRDQADLVAGLTALARRHRVTLVYSARDTDHNQAVALAEFLRERDEHGPSGA